ncbi:uncharacterized protein LOC126859169 isoform X1 [Cataglyphis hispanica]|uniref:uncharacterized protein LOC126859169 isoform X1 n=1 Tax=Cataglyphis hispanica TaxID=1086592 RepID=UPI00217FBC16|nr:uncharacterized protein LOC126859169 isoform X1 [Cataglyphis hispanica]
MTPIERVSAVIYTDGFRPDGKTVERTVLELSHILGESRSSALHRHKCKCKVVQRMEVSESFLRQSCRRINEPSSSRPADMCISRQSRRRLFFTRRTEAGIRLDQHSRGKSAGTMRKYESRDLRSNYKWLSLSRCRCLLLP